MSPIARFFRSRKVHVLLAVVAVLVLVRALLPIAIERYANKTLDSLEGYSGHIEDVDLSLIRGAYTIEGVQIVKTGGKVPAPFFSAREIDLSIEWGALLDGAIVSEIDVYAPKINFVASPTKDERNASEEQVEPADNWTDVVKELTPFSINRFAIHDGAVHYRDFGSDPKVNVYVQDLTATARNLTNSEDRSGSLVATFEGKALAMSSGKVKFSGKVDPYAEQPTFDAAIRLDNLDLRQLNPYLRAYTNVDVEKGLFSVDGEFAASEGQFRGYIKPFIDQLDVLRWKEEGESLPNKAWQAVVELAGEILQDQDRERAATRVPFKGRFEQPDIDVWAAVGSLLRNAFVESLRRGLEGSIDIQRVAGSDEAVDLTESKGGDEGKDDKKEARSKKEAGSKKQKKED